MTRRVSSHLIGQTYRRAATLKVTLGLGFKANALVHRLCGLRFTGWTPWESGGGVCEGYGLETSLMVRPHEPPEGFPCGEPECPGSLPVVSGKPRRGRISEPAIGSPGSLPAPCRPVPRWRTISPRLPVPPPSSVIDVRPGGGDGLHITPGTGGGRQACRLIGGKPLRQLADRG